MVDNWFKLIGSFNISQPNLFFLLAIILGVVIAKFSNELPANSFGKSFNKFLSGFKENYLRFLNKFFAKLKTKSSSHSAKTLDNQSLPPAQKLYSIKPIELTPSNPNIRLIEDATEDLSLSRGNAFTPQDEILEIKPLSTFRSHLAEIDSSNSKQVKRWEDFEESFRESPLSNSARLDPRINKTQTTKTEIIGESNEITTYKMEEISSLKCLKDISQEINNIPATSKPTLENKPQRFTSQLSSYEKENNPLAINGQEIKEDLTIEEKTGEDKRRQELVKANKEKKSVKVNILKEDPNSRRSEYISSSQNQRISQRIKSRITEEEISEAREISYKQVSEEALELDKSENYLPDELFREGQDGLTFYPLIEVKGSSIPRFKQIEFLKNLYRNENLLFLTGASSSGKSYLSSLYAREVKFTENCSVLSFSFNQNVNSLAEGIRLMMVEQLGTTSRFNENTIAEFFGTISSKPHLIILGNVDFLSKDELASLDSYASPHCRILLVSHTLTARSICQINPEWKNNIYELPPIEHELVQNYFLDRIPTAFKSSPSLVNRLIRLVRGNPLALNLFCSLQELQVKRNRESTVDELFKLIDLQRVVNDGKLPINLCKLLSLLFPRLSPLQRDVLLYCSYFPINAFSSSLIEAVFEVSETECLQTLDALSQAGLIQRVAGQPFKEPCFAVHSIIKDFIYSQHRLEELKYVELINRTAAFFLSIMQDESRLKRENIIFVTSGLGYCLKLIKGDFSEKPHLLPLFEKALDFLYAVGLIKKIERELIFIYKDNLEQSSSQSVKVFWNKLVGLAYLMIAKENPDMALRNKGIQDGIELLNNSLHMLPSNSNPYQAQKLHNDIGNAYLSLSETEASEAHLIKAVEHLKKAIQIEVSGKHSTSYILAHINLGNVYIKLYQLKPSALTLHLSSQILIKCLKNFSKELPLDVLSSVNQNIANSLRLLAGHEEPIVNLESAVGFYKEALLGADLQNKALILNSIGCCFWKLTKYKSPAQNIQLAISFYRKSMGIVIDENGKIVEIFDPIECAVTLNNLGISYKTLASIQDPETNYPLALKAFRESLRIAEERQDKNLSEIINKHISELYYAIDILMNQKGANARFKESFTNSHKTLD